VETASALGDSAKGNAYSAGESASELFPIFAIAGKNLRDVKP
jgi:hypothetical protein